MRGQGGLDSFGTILAGLSRRLGLESKLFEARLRRRWPDIVGEPIAAHTRPDQLRFKKLYLFVRNSVWLQQLTFLKPVLLQKVNEEAGQALVAEIVLRIGDCAATSLPALHHTASEPKPVEPTAQLLHEAACHTQGIQDDALRRQLTSVMVQSLTRAEPPARPSR